MTGGGFGETGQKVPVWASLLLLRGFQDFPQQRVRRNVPQGRRGCLQNKAVRAKRFDFKTGVQQAVKPVLQDGGFSWRQFHDQRAGQPLSPGFTGTRG